MCTIFRPLSVSVISALLGSCTGVKLASFSSLFYSFLLCFVFCSRLALYSDYSSSVLGLGVKLVLFAVPLLLSVPGLSIFEMFSVGIELVIVGSFFPLTSS